MALDKAGNIFIADTSNHRIRPVAAQVTPQYPAYPSETPAMLLPGTDGFDYVRREVMIPMRDGVQLHAVILLPRGAHGAPILLTRTPYDASALTSNAPHPHNAMRPSSFIWS